MSTTPTWPTEKYTLDPIQWSSHFSGLEAAYQNLKETDPSSTDFNRVSIAFDVAAAAAQTLPTAETGVNGTSTIQASVDLDGNLRIIQSLWSTANGALLGRWELVSS